MKTIAEKKSSLRALIKSKLKEIANEDYRKSCEKKFTDNLKNLFESFLLEEKALIGSFASLKDEPLFDLGAYETAYPIENSSGVMSYRVGKSGALSFKKQFGVNLKTLEQGEEKNPDILLIPGLAFDLEGGRLGRGGGFFDRYLENYKGIKIGVCFDFQVMSENVPRLVHDQRVDFLVTQIGVSDCRQFAN